MSMATLFSELAQALEAMVAGKVARMLKAGPAELFREPALRHRINASPHNRASAHALALETLFISMHGILRLASSRASP